MHARKGAFGVRYALADTPTSRPAMARAAFDHLQVGFRNELQKLCRLLEAHILRLRMTGHVHRYSARNGLHARHRSSLRARSTTYSLMSEVARAGVYDRLQVRDGIELAGFRGVDQVEQVGKWVAQADAAARGMTYVEYPPQLGIEVGVVVGVAILPRSDGASAPPGCLHSSGYAGQRPCCLRRVSAEN
jgi:hypothetical protein